MVKRARRLCWRVPSSGRRRDPERGMGVATTQDTREKIIVPGPAGFHPPSAAQLGVALPDPGEGLFYGLLEPNEEIVIEEMARKMLTSPNATIFPGPLLLWAWNDH